MKTLNIYSKEMQPVKNEEIFPSLTANKEQINESNVSAVSQKVEPGIDDAKSHKIGR